MPQKINMFISNGNFSLPQIKTPSNNSFVSKPTGSLNSSIIARIQNVRPGCGSCGRK